jgi:amino acid transporter
MSVIGAFEMFESPAAFWQPFIPEDSTVLGSFGTGLFVVMWNYLGWDGLSTVSDEIHEPKRNFPKGLALTIPLVTLAYLLPVGAGLQASPDWAGWTAGYFPEVAAAVGGKWLGAWMAIGGLVSAAALFNALMLSISRLPYVMASDGFLPQFITKRHPKYDTPWVAIIVCASIYSFFTLSAFSSLVVIDVIVYSASLLLEFAALIALRINEPKMRRPVRVPGGWFGVTLVTLLPTLVLALAVYSTYEEEGVGALWLSAAALATGPILYPLLVRFVKKDIPTAEVPIEYEEMA